MYLLLHLNRLSSTLTGKVCQRPACSNLNAILMRCYRAVYILCLCAKLEFSITLKIGIARFATAKYEPSNPDNLYSHLTNTSINKYNPEKNRDSVGAGAGAGCKVYISKTSGNQY